jgi:hypothetical protein
MIRAHYVKVSKVWRQFEIYDKFRREGDMHVYMHVGK